MFERFRIVAIVDDQQAFLEADSAIGSSTKQYAITLGGSFRRGRAQMDLALTGILYTGNNVSEYYVATADGLTYRLDKQPISGYAVFVSVGGTYAFEDDDDEDKCNESPHEPAAPAKAREEG